MDSGSTRDGRHSTGTSAWPLPVRRCPTGPSPTRTTSGCLIGTERTSTPSSRPPLDYALWKNLEQKSAIASRLYEFLLLNFHGTDELRINYETLVKYLPLKSEVYLSQAKQQLRGALDLLAENGLVRLVGWESSQSGLALLHLGKGERFARLPTANDVVASTTFELGEAVEVKELRGQHPPEWHLVSDFYREWTKQSFCPSVDEGTRPRSPTPHHRARAATKSAASNT